MRIGLLSAAGGSVWQGGVHYVTNLISTLKSLPDRERPEVHLLLNVEGERGLYESVLPVADSVHVQQGANPRGLAGRIADSLRRRLGSTLNPALLDLAKRAALDFVYPTIFFPNRRDDVRAATWLPDFQFRNLPEGTNPADVRAREAEFSYAANNAPRIVLSSAVAERECHGYYPAARGHTHVYRFKVVLPEPLLAQDPGEVVRRYHLPERYLAVPNLVAPTKNHLGLLRALARTSGGARGVQVVCTGGLYDYRNPGFVHQVVEAIHLLGLHDRVRFLGALPRPDQLQVLRGATGIVQPSRHEGWSTSVEEGRLLGKPLLLSDLPVHREQADFEALFFDPADPDDLAAQLDAIWRKEGGFDRAAEERARAAYSEEVRGAGRAFLQIARSPAAA